MRLARTLGTPSGLDAIVASPGICCVVDFEAYRFPRRAFAK